MPIIRIGNYEVPHYYRTEFDVETAHREWRRDVRQVLWQAIAAMAVPGLERREHVTITFDSERDELDTSRPESVDPCVAYIIIEGLEDRFDRPIKLRHDLAVALGQALLDNLPENKGWSVEVLPKRYSSEHEGAVMVRARDSNSEMMTVVLPSDLASDMDKSATPPLRYKFRLSVTHVGRPGQDVWTAAYTFASVDELVQALVGCSKFRYGSKASDRALQLAALHPVFRVEDIEYWHRSQITVQEAFPVK